MASTPFHLVKISPYETGVTASPNGTVTGAAGARGARFGLTGSIEAVRFPMIKCGSSWNSGSDRWIGFASATVASARGFGMATGDTTGTDCSGAASDVTVTGGGGATSPTDAASAEVEIFTASGAVRISATSGAGSACALEAAFADANTAADGLLQNVSVSLPAHPGQPRMSAAKTAAAP
ncbi:MAG TPA: hypothetical protein VMC05_09170 [Xanthobacteraceae bacterium]|nr:hypothetical protein [Xanthobacteraceae bacterium]